MLRSIDNQVKVLGFKRIDSEELLINVEINLVPLGEAETGCFRGEVVALSEALDPDFLGGGDEDGEGVLGSLRMLLEVMVSMVTGGTVGG